MNVMKPIASDDIPKGEEWFYEVKYDGFRCLVDWDLHEIKLISKSKKDLTDQFPEIVDYCLQHQPLIEHYLPLKLDGELVILNTAYQANFSTIQQRGRLKHSEKINHAAKRRPATFMVFDVLKIKGISIENKFLEERKIHLKKIMDVLTHIKNKRMCLVNTFDVVDKIWKLIFDYKAEGLIAKRKTSVYHPGKRHHDWFKIKNWRHIQGILHSYHVSNGYFSIKVFKNNDLYSIGKCKHGLRDDVLQTLTQVFLTRGEKQGDEYTLPPAIVAAIHTLDLSDDELREPSFNELSVNASAKECTFKKLRQDLAMFPEMIDLSNLDKVFWPESMLTKRELLIYFRDIAPYMLPFMRQRALTIIRCPDGMDGDHFFQKHLPDYAPEFMHHIMTEENEKRMICADLESLIWLANHGAIEYHLPFQRVFESTPDEIVFDLDPPSREKFNLAIDAALLIKEMLDHLKLISFVKTSGNKGLQIHIPISEKSLSYQETALFTKAIAWAVVQINPDKFTTERFKNQRKGRLYIDYVQHGKNKTIIAPYSPRKTADATVATPLFWEEVTNELRPEPFTINRMLDRVQSYGCPFKHYFESGKDQPLDHIKQMIND